ncbi:MAG TPA: proline iminopeptidase-family hydrolase [Ktedonobacterales bacterium]|nr:proline iminopeptidase-family hydrolase [Ktedonobacterales bacterium]
MPDTSTSSASSRPSSEGYIPFHGYRTWYRIVGDPANDTQRPPVIVLHGGPGVPHDYLENLEALADSGRRVIFYDQLGCGRSDQPHQPDLWTVPLYVEELGVVRQALGLDRVHILGQSWGGMLAMEYALTQPGGVASLIIESSPSSIPLWVAEANRLRDELPPDVQATLLRHEQDGTTDSPDYQQVMLVFYNRHVCRMQPWPDYVQRALENMGQEVYNTMNGPSEFHVIGTLKDWDITPRLGEIRLPTLLLSGRYDEATPRVMEVVHQGIAGSEWVIFEQSSHMSHCEEESRYLDVVNAWLSRHDG